MNKEQMAVITAEIKKSIKEQNPYTLWFFVPDRNQTVKLPVYSYLDAAGLVEQLNKERVSGIRIARMDPSEGCEVVLHKFDN
ncbi:hypothetical protein [Pseudomonas phage 98PfluR60PP]|uniref:Uncharacterized protein n=1 Tax=Pseudomonas phage 98PfluR60PP TaxID=2163965 RepID=A0A2S1PFZ9_9CAUD|nr:hypothetical protein PP760_gp64 [Pseudomonas phage 98PfluR60PP]AWH15496.1 hypothetical protein [Pseudomonas phage 98PfluR60PP]